MHIERENNYAYYRKQTNPTPAPRKRTDKKKKEKIKNDSLLPSPHPPKSNKQQSTRTTMIK